MGLDAIPDKTPVWIRNTWTQQLQAYEQEFTAHGYGRPALWLTEFGWPGDVTPSGDYGPSLATQAADVAQAYEALESPRPLSFVQAAFWFNQRDYETGAANPDPGFFAHYGLLFNDFEPKPASERCSSVSRARDVEVFASRSARLAPRAPAPSEGLPALGLQRRPCGPRAARGWEEDPHVHRQRGDPPGLFRLAPNVSAW